MRDDDMELSTKTADTFCSTNAKIGKIGEEKGLEDKNVFQLKQQQQELLELQRKLQESL